MSLVNIIRSIDVNKNIVKTIKFSLSKNKVIVDDDINTGEKRFVPYGY